MLRYLLCVYALAFSSFPPPGSAAEAAVRVEQAWIREPPPAAAVLAGYMSITNDGGAPVGITGVESDAFERVEMHRTVIENGIARMAGVDTLEIPAGTRIVLEPGALHMMLIGPRRELGAGDHVDLTLMLSDGSRLTVTAEVRSTAGEGHRHHQNQ
jgi:copper(I)-binding protein